MTAATGTLLLRGGRVVDPAQGIDRIDDVLVRDGKVVVIGQSHEAADATIDAKGLVVSPGLIDMHVHLREPGREEDETIETGTRAVLASPALPAFPTPSRRSTRRRRWSSSARKRPAPTPAMFSWWAA